MRNVKNLLIVAVTVSAIAMLVLPSAATADNAKKKAAKAEIQGPRGTVTMTDGMTHPEAVKGTEWVTYDDGSQETWGFLYAPSGGAAGNKFTSTWGTFYCDMVSGYFFWVSSGTSLYLSMWTGTTNTGADLTGNTSVWIGSAVTTTSGSGWIVVDGSVTPVGFVGDSGSAFNNTAWVGAYVASGGDVGVDTNGGGSHGFYLSAYGGTGYTETNWNAVLRARFNGDNVPVELMSFNVD